MNPPVKNSSASAGGSSRSLIDDVAIALPWLPNSRYGRTVPLGGATLMLFDIETDPVLRSQILERFAAELMTDVERARLFGLPEGCRIRERAKILAPEKLKCGKHLWIGEGAVLDAQGGLEIGDYTQIGTGVMIWTHSSYKQAILGETGRTREHVEYRPTKIGSRVFIAGPSVVLPGVTIGDGAIIQPLTLVSRDILPSEAYGTALEMRRMVRRIEVLEATLSQRSQASIK